MQFERDQSLLQLAESISYKWGRLWSWQSYKMTVIAQFEKNRSSPPEADLGKDVLKICSKFTGEHPCVTVNSIKLLCNVIEITLQHGCSPVNLLHISRTPFPWNTSVWPLLFSSSCLLNSIQPLVAEFNFCHLID